MKWLKAKVMKLIHWINSKVRGSTGLRCGSFSEKSIEKKKHLCCHDENYDYFFKANAPVISVIKDSGNKIKVSKNMSL